METKNILGDFWKNYAEKQETKIAKNVCYELNKEKIFAIILCNDKTFWIEDNYYNPPSKKVYEWIVKKVEKLYGARFLYGDTNRVK